MHIFGHIYMSLGYYHVVLPPWHDSATCSIFELHAWIRPIIVRTSRLLYCRMESPKAIPCTNWVPSRVLFSDVNFSRKNYGFAHSVWSSNTIFYSSFLVPLTCMFPFPPLVHTCMFFHWSYPYSMTPDCNSDDTCRTNSIRWDRLLPVLYL